MLLEVFLLLFTILYGPRIYRFIALQRHKRRLASAIPGKDGLPILGNLLELGRTPETLPKTFHELASENLKAGHSFMRFYVVHEVVVVPLNGEALKHILDSTEEIVKGEDYDSLVPWLGRGLLTSTGDKWRSRRKLLTPTFHFTNLDGYLETMNRHARVLVEILSNRTGQETDMYPFIKRCTLDIICEAAMGKELDTQNSPSQPYCTAIGELAKILMDMSMLPHLWFAPIRWILGIESRFRRCIQIAHDFTDQVIRERRELIRRGEVEPSKRAFLDLLLGQQQEQGLSDEDIREEVDTFMFAGHDTTTSAISWVVWCLACNPDAQQKAYEEVADVFASNHDGDCDKEILHRLVYLERCIKEAMRIFPPVPLQQRSIQADTQMGPYLVPRGASLIIAPWAVHHNENIYPDSWTFDPDNFTQEKVSSRHPYDYIPFSAGPRNCIGQRFALHEVKVTLTWLLRRLRFESERPMRWNSQLAEMVLRPGKGVPVTLHERKQ